MSWVRMPCRRGAQVAALALVALSAPAAAQDAAEAHTEAVMLGAAPEDDQTLFELMVGVTGNSGNTRAVSGNGGFTFLLKRRPHVFTLEGLGTLGYANILGDGTDDLQRNSANFVGRARYDYFLSDKDALFAAVVPRRDVFAGIAARIQVQAGYARVLYNKDDALRLWGEIGGDATIDRYEPIEQEDGTFNDPEDTEIYSVRLFLGYENMLSEAAQMKLGVEALLPPYDKRGEDDPMTPENDSQYRYRINGNAELHSSLTSRFKMGAAFRVLYDSSPPAGTPSKVDTITTFLLTYTYDSVAEKPAEPAAECPPCEEASPEASAAPSEYEEAKAANEDAVGGPVEASEAEAEAAEAAAAAEAAEATAPAEAAAEVEQAEPPPAGTTEAPLAPPAEE